MINSHERLSLASLIAAFGVAFILACGLLITLGHFWLNSPRSIWPLSSIGPNSSMVDQNQPDFEPFLVNRDGSYLKAQIGRSANPVTGEDYLFLLWFRLRRAPGVGESVGVVGKFDSQIAGKPGYAVALEGAPDGVRPKVYLSVGEPNGRWYSFSSYPMNRRDWYLLAVSFVDDAFVSASLGKAFSREAPVLLGGHRIAVSGLPHSEADIVVGAFGSSKFRGQIGPFGVLVGQDLGERITEVVKVAQLEPKAAAPDLSGATVRLWGSPSKDLGPSNIPINGDR